MAVGFNTDGVALGVVVVALGWVVVAFGCVVVALGRVAVVTGVVETDLAEITGALAVEGCVVPAVL